MRLSPGRWRHLRTQARQRKIAALIAQSPYFDADFYLAQAPDVAARPYWAENPALHYLLYGGQEGRRPSACFNSGWYLDQYPDVKAAGMNPLLHYLHHGRTEGRLPRPLLALTWHERLWSSEAIEAQRAGASGTRNVARQPRGLRSGSERCRLVAGALVCLDGSVAGSGAGDEAFQSDRRSGAWSPGATSAGYRCSHARRRIRPGA
ncbi:MAG: hypothetical protein MZV65_32590 [Chromatiales bacterium]|nr:hypothetical protein [Chromatiales bacterium]MCK7579949.1 hypothetical protein [Chromatiales bacterium]